MDKCSNPSLRILWLPRSPQEVRVGVIRPGKPPRSVEVIAEGEGNTKWIKKGREGKDQWQSRDQLQFVPLTPPSKFPLKKRALLAFWRSFLEKVYEEDSL